jgi:hypothetical protein
MKRLTVLAMAGALALGTLAGCTPREHQATAIGAAGGAAAGAVASRSVGGMLVGSGIGAAAGYAFARNTVRCQKRNIFGQLYWGWCLRR